MMNKLNDMLKYLLVLLKILKNKKSNNFVRYLNLKKTLDLQKSLIQLITLEIFLN